MGCKTIVEQLAEALGKSEVNNTDQLPVVENGTLWRVTIGDLATSLGLTGSITGLNGGSATPVLKGTAPNYQVRGIVGGDGASVSVNANDSITVDVKLSNAGNSGDGAPLIPNTSGSTIAFRRLIAGNGINIVAQANNLVIENTEIAVSNKTVIVSELSDFPTPASGVITLADNVIYFLANNISTSNRFVLGQGTIITSNDPLVTLLTYTGTGTMFTFANGNAGIKEIGIACPNGTVFDSSGVTSGLLLVRYVLFTEVKNFGNLKHTSIGIYDCYCVLHTGAGFTMGAITGGRFRSENIVFQSTTDATAILLDLDTATFDEFSVDSWQVLASVSGQKLLKGLAAAANLTGSTIGFVTGCVIQGSMVALDTISPNEAGWDFTDNNKTPDTEPRAQLYLSTGATTTVTAASTDYVVAGTFVEDIASVYSTNVNGRATYLGRRDKYVRADITMSFEPSSGSNKALQVGLRLNGTTVAETRVSRTVSAGSAAVVSIDWGFELSKNDYIEVVVRNNTDTTDILVNQLLIRVA